MKIPSLFRQKKNNTYNYTPRYYNERKERLDDIKKKYEVKTDESSINRSSNVNFRDEWLKNRKSTSDSNTRLRLIIILIFLFLFAYISLRYVNLDKFF
jgi:hypothetical protein